MNKDQLAARLLTTFVGELDEQVRLMNEDLLALERAPGDPERLKSLFRTAHTLKGASRAAGVREIEDACHALEGLLAQARDGRLGLDQGHFALLFAAADALADAGRRVRAGQSFAGSPLAELRQDLKRGRKEPLAVAGATPPAEVEGPRDVRVRAEKLDELLAAGGQLTVATERSVGLVREIRVLQEFAARWETSWRRGGPRLRIALERAGATEIASRWLRETEENVRLLVRETGRIEAGAAADARALAQAAEDVAARIRGIRMQPFTQACESLPRVARDVAAAGDKEVRLVVTGGAVELDRAVLDGLRDVLLQLVRNAVDHGIESRPARMAAGKPASGIVTVSAALKGERVMVTVADDGAGLDVKAIRAQLLRRGLALPADDRELVQSLYESGFSTRADATAISGRGVGLDIVRAAVGRIRGSVDITWEAGRGTTFSVACPPTLASVRALLVAVDEQVVALPTIAVERLIRVGPADIRRAEGRDVVATADGPVLLVPLARLLPPLAERPAAGPILAAILTSAERRLAVAVDELLAEQELVLRPLGGDGAPAHVGGAAILGSGRVALVLDPTSLVAAGLGEAGAAAGVGPKQEAGRTQPLVLVVDDSITTRTLEQSILEAAGYEVATAVDGEDAWRQLQEHGADLVVADVEMPRMDGFALTEAIRKSKRFKDLPVVLVTALEKPEHRARGLDVGADAYLGKSSFDQHKLLELVRELVGSQKESREPEAAGGGRA